MARIGASGPLRGRGGVTGSVPKRVGVRKKLSRIAWGAHFSISTVTPLSTGTLPIFIFDHFCECACELGDGKSFV